MTVTGFTANTNGSDGKYTALAELHAALLNLQAQITALEGSLALTPVDQRFETRTALAAAKITGAGTTVNTVLTGGYAAPGDGGGAQYKWVALGPAHAGKVQSTDGSWWELVPENGTIRLSQLGAPRDGTGDCALYLEEALAICNSVDLGGDDNTWRFATQVGIPDTPDLYVDRSIEIFGSGANVVLAGVTELFTSASFKADPTLTTNAFASKINFRGLNFTETAASIVFDMDHLYNVIVSGCHFDSITTVGKSSHSKAGVSPEFTAGYIQSFAFLGNFFIQCGKIVDAKHAYNFSFCDNECEVCTAGIYINGNGEPAIAGATIERNLFEGGGAFLDLGDYTGLTVQGNYLEHNTGGDVATFLGYMRFSKVGGSELFTGDMTGNNIVMTAGQATLPIFFAFRFDAMTIPMQHTALRNNWTNGKLAPDMTAMVVEGNRSSETPRLPRAPATARVDVTDTSLLLANSTHVSGSSYTVAKFILQNWAIRMSNTRPFVAELVMFMQHMPASGVVVGADYFRIGLMLQGPEGAGEDQDYVWADAKMLMHLPSTAGRPISSASPTSLTVEHFTNPAVSISESGGVCSILISGYGTPAVPHYGAASQMRNNITITAYCRNGSNNIAIGDDIAFVV